MPSLPSRSFSVVYGMPAVAAALGAVERLLPLERIAAALVELERAATR